MSKSWFEQIDFRCRLEWGRDGARRAAKRGDVLVVVDTLRFSTTVATAVHCGVTIYPCRDTDDAGELAERVGAEVAALRSGERARYSLSPLAYLNAERGARVVVRSPNGATCARLADVAPMVFAGALVNALAVAEAVEESVADSGMAVTVVACGERLSEYSEDGPLRFAIEDYLGAGAVLASLSLTLSPEAEVCRAAFAGVRNRLPQILDESGSGIELREKGLAADVAHAACIDLYDVAPVMQGGRFVPYRFRAPRSERKLQ